MTRFNDKINMLKASKRKNQLFTKDEYYYFLFKVKENSKTPGKNEYLDKIL